MRKLYGGFVNGKLDMTEMDTGWGGYGSGSIAIIPAIFTSKAEAKKRYEDVRGVEVLYAGKR